MRPARRRRERDTQASENTASPPPGSGCRAALQPRDADDPARQAPRAGDGAGRRVPDRARRAHARRECTPERRDLRVDLDGATGRAAHGGVLRQEHDRQGRVSADRGARDALRRNPREPVARAGRGFRDGLFHDGLERSGDARRARAQATLAEAAPGGGQADGRTQPRDGDQRPGVLGEVRELLGRRDASRPDGGRPLPPLRGGGRAALRREHDRRRRDPRLDLRRLVRAREGDLRCPGRAPGRDRARRPRPRRRRVGRDDRPVPRRRPRMGLPARNASRRSTPRGTSTGSSIPESGGSSGATPPRSRRI